MTIRFDPTAGPSCRLIPGPRGSFAIWKERSPQGLGPGGGRFGSRACRWARVLAVAMLLAGPMTGGLEASADPAPEPPGPAGPRLVWQTRVPMGYTVSIRSCHLVGGRLFLMLSDGMVHAFRAHDGHYLWGRRLAGELDTLWPPVAAQLVLTPEERMSLAAGSHGASGESMEVVVFTRILDVLFLDPRTGQIVRRDPTVSSNNTAVAAWGEWLYQASPQRRINCLSIRDGFLNWQLSTPGTLSLAPVFVPQDDILYFADDSGVVGGVTPARERRFTVELYASPRGWLAVGDDSLYLATDDRRLHALERRTGRIRWQYDLPGWVRGGPVVSADSVYQAIHPTGVQRVGKEPIRPNWFDPRALSFLAEWGEETVLLRPGGVLALWDRRSGGLSRQILLGEWIAMGIGNTRNQALLLVGKDGRLACYLPVRVPLPAPDSWTESEGSAAPPAAKPAMEPAVSTSDSGPPRLSDESPGQTPTGRNPLLDDPLRSEIRLGQP